MSTHKRRVKLGQLEAGDVFRVKDTAGQWIEVVPVTVAAELCQVTTRTIQRALADKHLEGFAHGRSGHDWVVSMEAVRRVLDKGWREATGRKRGRPTTSS